MIAAVITFCYVAVEKILFKIIMANTKIIIMKKYHIYLAGEVLICRFLLSLYWILWRSDLFVTRWESRPVTLHLLGTTEVLGHGDHTSHLLRYMRTVLTLYTYILYNARGIRLYCLPVLYRDTVMMSLLCRLGRCCVRYVNCDVGSTVWTVMLLHMQDICC